MMATHFDSMNLDELRQYVLSHREDVNAFQIYVDYSKALGSMITIALDAPGWEKTLEKKIQQTASGKTEPY